MKYRPYEWKTIEHEDDYETGRNTYRGYRDPGMTRNSMDNMDFDR